MISEELVIAISIVAIILSVISLLGNYYFDRMIDKIDKREKEIEKVNENEKKIS